MRGMQTYDNKAQCSPKATLPKATDFSDILTMDLKELTPGHKEGGYRYILYVIDEFTKYKKAVLIRDMEAGMVINAVHSAQWSRSWRTQVTYLQQQQDRVHH